jgi:hypothetical protein
MPSNGGPPGTEDHSGSSKKRTDEQERPKRDWYDFVSLGVQAAGVVALVATIIVTQHIAAAGSSDMTKAINAVSKIGNTLVGQQAAIIRQSKATVALEGETGTVATATRQEAGTAREAVRNQQVGNVKITAGEIENWGSTTDPPRFTFWFENVGTTTIYNAKISLALAPFRNPYDPAIWRDFSQDYVETIPPTGKEPTRISAPNVVNQDVWDKIFHAKLFVLVGARIRFRNSGYAVPETRYICFAYAGPFNPPSSIACPTPAQGRSR